MFTMTITEDNTRFLWELEVQLYNLLVTNKRKPEETLVLTYSELSTPSKRLSELVEKYGFVHHHYEYTHPEGVTYRPSVRFALWKSFLTENEKFQKETFLYIDSDVIFTDMSRAEKIPAVGHHWYASDISDYASMRAFMQVIGPTRGMLIHRELKRIFPIDPNRSYGAQYVISHPTPEFMADCFIMSNFIYKMFEHMKDKKIMNAMWMSDIFAIQCVCKSKGISLDTHIDLDFALATEPITQLEVVNIIHNSGNMELPGIFNKTLYDKEDPKVALSEIDPRAISYRYVEELFKAQEHSL